MDHPESASVEIIPAGARRGPGWETDRAPAVRTGQLRDRTAAAWLRSKHAGHTQEAYRRDITAYFAWADEFDVDVLAAVQIHLDGYRHHLETAEHRGRRRAKSDLQPATVARKLSTVSSFYRYAVRQGVALVNPVADVDRPAVADESMTAGLDVDEVGRLLDAAERTGPRARALVLMLLGLGLRVSELVAADTGHLSREGGRMVLRVTRKGGKQQRLGVPDAAARALDAYIGPRRGPLFLDRAGRERITRRQVDYLLRALATAAAITTRISPHSLRHTAATLALNAGAPLRDVQVQLGHARPSTTARYDRARRDLNNDAARALADIVNRTAGRRPVGDLT